MRPPLNCSFRLRPAAASLTLILLLFASAGCSGDESSIFVLALQPFFTPQDNEPDPGLTGTWASKEEDLAFSFTPTEDHKFEVVVHEKDGDREFESRFEGHLIRIGATRFLDLYPVSLGEGSDFYRLHFLRCHTAARLDLAQDTLELTFLSPQWLSQHLKDKTLDVSHETIDGVVMLTGTTTELQDFLFMNSNDDEAFHDPLLLEKQPTSEAL